MSKLEVTEEGDSLSHAHVAIGFKAYISNWSSWIYKSNDILCNDIQSWCLVCSGSNNTDGKSEEKGHNSSKDKPPPWKLNFMFQKYAKY